MKQFLRQRWFLLLLAAGIVLAWWGPAWLRASTAQLGPRAIIALALFLMAWGLESRKLFGALLRPLPALWAVAISYGVVPACAVLVGPLLTDDFRIGLVIIASVPCTLASAVLWTRMAGGNEATALLVILLTTASSWLVTTAWVVLGTGTVVSIDTAAMIRDLLVFLILPVALGQSIRSVPILARTAVRWKLVLGVVSQLLIFSIILKAGVELFDRLREGESSEPKLGALWMAALLCLGTHLAALAGGFWSSRALRFDRPSQIAVAFACSQKTLPVALVLFDYFKERYPLAVVPMVLYHLGQLFVDTFIADGLAGRPLREGELPPEAVL
jgi:sodium/bile acid cotransporter 7